MFTCIVNNLRAFLDKTISMSCKTYLHESKRAFLRSCSHAALRPCLRTVFLVGIFGAGVGGCSAEEQQYSSSSVDINERYVETFVALDQPIDLNHCFYKTNESEFLKVERFDAFQNLKGNRKQQIGFAIFGANTSSRRLDANQQPGSEFEAMSFTKSQNAKVFHFSWRYYPAVVLLDGQDNTEPQYWALAAGQPNSTSEQSRIEIRPRCDEIDLAASIAENETKTLSGTVPKQAFLPSFELALKGSSNLRYVNEDINTPGSDKTVSAYFIARALWSARNEKIRAKIEAALSAGVDSWWSQIGIALDVENADGSPSNTSGLLPTRNTPTRFRFIAPWICDPIKSALQTKQDPCTARSGSIANLPTRDLSEIGIEINPFASFRNDKSFRLHQKTLTGFFSPPLVIPFKFPDDAVSEPFTQFDFAAVDDDWHARVLYLPPHAVFPRTKPTDKGREAEALDPDRQKQVELDQIREDQIDAYGPTYSEQDRVGMTRLQFEQLQRGLEERAEERAKEQFIADRQQGTETTGSTQEGGGWDLNRDQQPSNAVAQATDRANGTPETGEQQLAMARQPPPEEVEAGGTPVDQNTAPPEGAAADAAPPAPVVQYPSFNLIETAGFSPDGVQTAVFSSMEDCETSVLGEGATATPVSYQFQKKNPATLPETAVTQLMRDGYPISPCTRARLELASADQKQLLYSYRVFEQAGEQQLLVISPSRGFQDRKVGNRIKRALREWITQAATQSPLPKLEVAYLDGNRNLSHILENSTWRSLAALGEERRVREVNKIVNRFQFEVSSMRPTADVNKLYRELNEHEELQQFIYLVDSSRERFYVEDTGGIFALLKNKKLQINVVSLGKCRQWDEWFGGNLFQCREIREDGDNAKAQLVESISAPSKQMSNQ